MKTRLIIGFFILFALAPAAFSAVDTGCCLNPLAASDVYCNAAPQGISKATCCPSNDASYYYSTQHPYGPETKTECEQNYFAGGTSCSAYSTGSNDVCSLVW